MTKNKLKVVLHKDLISIEPILGSYLTYDGKFKKGEIKFINCKSTDCKGKSCVDVVVDYMKHTCKDDKGKYNKYYYDQCRECRSFNLYAIHIKRNNTLYISTSEEDTQAMIK